MSQFWETDPEAEGNITYEDPGATITYPDDGGDTDPGE